MLVASALMSWKFGGLVENASFKGGFSRVARKLTPDQEATYAWVRQQAEAIPRDAIIGATKQDGTARVEPEGGLFLSGRPRRGRPLRAARRGSSRARTWSATTRR